VAGLLTSLSTAAGQGNAGAILTAGSGLPLRRSRGGELNDVTGDQAVREMIAKSRGQL